MRDGWNNTVSNKVGKQNRVKLEYKQKIKVASTKESIF